MTLQLEAVADWMLTRAEAELPAQAGMGEMEQALARIARGPAARALAALVQRRAAQTPMACPACKTPLRMLDRQRGRGVASLHGDIRFVRAYGRCPQCGQACAPADRALGLGESGTASPRVQEICAATVLLAPAGRGEEHVRRTSGVEISASTLHREARRQGERALALRDADEEKTKTPEGIAQLAKSAEVPPRPFTLVLEIDAWHIRERDDWGKTEDLRAQGGEAKRWHWVYTGTIFRLDQRGRTESGRALISSRGYVATRRGLESFTRQLYAEALRQGLAQAEHVLVVADGAVWIWNLVADRFPQARQRLDLYHARAHLWALAGELHGKGTPAASAWVRPYLEALETRADGAVEVIQGLREMEEKLAALTAEQREALRKEMEYVKNNQERMDYLLGRELGQPVGSGAIESTCSQYQRRFKLTGQYWSLEGDEELLALATLEKNHRWADLFPHDGPKPSDKNNVAQGKSLQS